MVQSWSLTNNGNIHWNFRWWGPWPRTESTTDVTALVTPLYTPALHLSLIIMDYTAVCKQRTPGLYTYCLQSITFSIMPRPACCSTLSDEIKASETDHVGSLNTRWTQETITAHITGRCHSICSLDDWLKCRTLQKRQWWTRRIIISGWIRMLCDGTHLDAGYTWLGDQQGRPSKPTNSFIHKLHNGALSSSTYNYNYIIFIRVGNFFERKLLSL